MKRGSLAAVLSIAGVLSLTFVVFAAQRQVPGGFRGRVVLVPVDVRVLDGDGNPVNNLTVDDFTILEDGEPQEIATFLRQSADSTPIVAESPRVAEKSGADAVSGMSRTFVLVLGRGRLEKPSRGLNSLTDFVRDRLLPQDRVAIVAYNRATDLTTDRLGILQFLDLYLKRHEEIEARLDHWFAGLQVRYGDHGVPTGIQSLIDELFDAAGAPPAREIAINDAAAVADFETDRRRLSEIFEPAALLDPGEGVALREGLDDLRNLFAAVEFLRFLEGEKHIIFLTENGLQLAGREPLWNAGISQSIAGADNAPRYDSFAALASDARVAVSTIQTGGLPLEFDEDTVNGLKVYLTRSRTFEQLFAITDTRAVAVKTGGMASAYRYADDALDRLDRATRFQYLIGYYPTNQNWDGGYRNIDVAVKERGVTLLYRQGYYARDSDASYDRRSFMTQNRILASAAADRVSRDLKVSVDVEAVTFRDGSGDVRVDLLIAPDRVMWLRDETGYHAKLTAAIFAAAGGRLVGEEWKQLDIDLSEESYRRLGDRVQLSYAAVVKVASRPTDLKAVVYDYLGDRVGSAATRLR